MPNSAEHETASAHKNKNAEKMKTCCFQPLVCCICHANKGIFTFMSMIVSYSIKLNKKNVFNLGGQDFRLFDLI